jgi:hypothetical protein
MGMKYSSKENEILTVRSMCTQDAKLLGSLASRLDMGHFAHEASRAAYELIGEYIASHGKAPSIKALLDDPDIHPDTRADLAEVNDQIEYVEEADQLIAVLQKYKQRRSIRAIQRMIEEETDGDTMDASRTTARMPTIRLSPRRRFTKITANKSSRPASRNLTNRRAVWRAAHWS